ncbi:MAG: protein kinase [Myxococcales bacterium]|nr:protein kinase [Myxococcales bacterium]
MKATLDGRPDHEASHASEAAENLGTTQMTVGASFDSQGAAPRMQTMVPNTDHPAPQSAPPAMPQDPRYQITSEIARGGMGRVVEATDTVLGRTVALKEALSLDAESLRRFKREVHITARLEHPSIVPVHDAGISPDGSPYYVMRKVTGRPLEELVARAPDLADRLAMVPHIVATTHAIAHAHSRGIVHRDIKPSNILVGDAGETIVIDWGLAKAIGEPDELRTTAPRVPEGNGEDSLHPPVPESKGADSLRPTGPERRGADSLRPTGMDDSLRTRAGIVFGTPGFMAPEQLRGAAVDERCDVYALGATLYHLLARKPPHHNKHADEVMRAAVAGPPVPLRELVPGVPPELATIVDKALAHDAKSRYQDAGALAEDLNRFLTGQLVASHHYSRSEKLGRFISKNRVPVAVAVAAIVAMIVGGWIAVRSIVRERDRADAQARLALSEKRVVEQQRQEVIAHVDQLTLKEAGRNAESNPTLAAAMIKPLAAKRWRSVRAVAAAARSSGIAFGLPASAHTQSLEMSRDGQRALAAGDDGVVRIYDLLHRKAVTVFDAKAAAMARFADGERRIVVFHGTILTIIDATSGAHHDVIAPGEVIKLAVSGPIVYWIDTVGAVWTLDLAATKPEKLSLGESVTAVVPSPDGRWVALAGGEHLLLVDRTQPAFPPEVIYEGAARDLAWAADASHIVGLIDQEVVDLSMMPARTVVQRMMVGNRNAVTYNGGRIATAGPTGIAFPSRDESRVRKETGDFTLGLREARGGVVVTGGTQGIVKVLSDDGSRTLQSPVARLSHLEASPSAAWVIAATDNLLLVWDLEAVQPHHVTQAAPSGVGFVSGDHAIVAFEGAPAQWIDLATGKASSLGSILPGISAVIAAPDRQRAVVIDGTHRARIVAASGDPIDVAGDIDLAAFIDDHQLVVATSQGELRLDDHAQQTSLGHHTGRMVALAATQTGWIAAASSDRALWRGKLGGRDATLAIPSAPPRAGLALFPDGTAAIATDRELRVWRTGAADAQVVATFEKPIAMISIIDPAKLFVVCTDGNLSLITLEGGRADMQRPIGATPSISTDGVIASISAAGLLELYDPVADEQWTLATPKSGQAFSAVQISADGRRVVAVTPEGLLVWTLALPQDADETVHWLGGMTNAFSDDGRTLSWK